MFDWRDPEELKALAFVIIFFGAMFISISFVE